MKEAYQKRYIVVHSNNGVPLSCQRYGTLREAVGRYGREVKEAQRLFNCDYQEARVLYEVKDIRTGETVL